MSSRLVDPDVFAVLGSIDSFCVHGSRRTEVAAAISYRTAVGGRASAHDVDEQLCAAVQQVAVASGGQEEQGDHRTVPAVATQWQAYKDPTFFGMERRDRGGLVEEDF
eukprot:CAMPEP_0177552318 /NCGR_PEP_ID=MMETSP0369-20130122/66747_1 /TAXON_ID=447022 ORGANISM="Scrippsiella hangoei-like, Strain SHHI-4" /NCGR_SAMPLE_ID=MMETSP0369 /ASSEMBLY_ACC=CAM_ASM_000364 /LENGTH=107 /DNA_ID=CAMNT_0019037989 /DNA_START=70 /DNA_END=391 /DNA_ORIENTATION=+